MRKFLPALLTLSLAAAPGCVLAIGNGPDDEGGNNNRIAHLEKRVSALEHQMAACGGECCEMDDDHDGHEGHPGPGGPGGPGTAPPPPMHPPGQQDPH